MCELLCAASLSCLTLCNTMDCSLPGCSVHGDSPGKNTALGFHALLQRIFPTQGSNPGLPYCRQILYCLSHWGRVVNKHIVRLYTHTHTHTHAYYISSLNRIELRECPTSAPQHRSTDLSEFCEKSSHHGPALSTELRSTHQPLSKLSIDSACHSFKETQLKDGFHG